MKAMVPENDGVCRRWCMKATVHEGIFIKFFNLKIVTLLQPSYFDQRLQPRGVVATCPLDFVLPD